MKEIGRLEKARYDHSAATKEQWLRLIGIIVRPMINSMRQFMTRVPSDPIGSTELDLSE